MATTTSVEWKDGMSFDVELQGHTFAVDADQEFGGRNLGPRPKGLLLSGLGGCTGMDVVSLLGKMKVPFDSFRVEVEGQVGEEHPKVYTSIHIRYVLTGSQLDPDKVKKAVGLSLDKYCGVTAMLSKTARVSHEIVLNPPS